MSEYPIYLVDDEEAVRRSVGFLLRTSNFTVRTYGDGAEFLRDVAKLEPGVLLLDIRMPETDGFEVQAELSRRGIALPVVVLTGHGDVEMAVKAMKEGAVDFLEKPFEKAPLMKALDEAFTLLNQSSRMSDRRKEAQILLNGLTGREKDVLEGLVHGYPNKTIAYDLGISPRTVEVYRANLMQKLEVTNLSDLLRIAFHAGMGEGGAPSAGRHEDV
jgi:two-component system response regulator FixJ